MTVTERRDYDDAYTTTFEATVAAHGEHAGRPAIALASTYFYPESGGQEADRGVIGAARVVDVQVGDDGVVWHVVEGAAPPPGATAPASIDWARRFDHMQQHTGQHVLSAAFEREVEAATLSSHLGETRSTIDVDRVAGDWAQVERVERAANAVIWEDREVVRHWVDDEGVKRWALRKPPQVRGRIRIVEVPGWDASACGGTHTRRTGEVGLVKIVRWERVRDRVRFEFLCGGRAWRDYAWRTAALVEAGRRRTIHDTQVLDQLERAAAERDDHARRMRELATALARHEAAAAVQRAPLGVAERRAVWTKDEARTFAFQCVERGAPWVAIAAEAPEPFVMIAWPRAGSGDLREMVPTLKDLARGKGGGSPDAVQVQAADAAAAIAAWEWAKSELPARVGPAAAPG